MSDVRSKFIGAIDKLVLQDRSGGADVNHRPLIKGNMARLDGQPFVFALWRHEKKDGSGHTLSGTVQPKDAAAALATILTSEDIALPEKLALKIGQIVLFQNNKGDNPKRPDYYGYSLTAEGVNSHSVWGSLDASLQLRGSTEPWTPTAAADAKVDVPAAAPTKPEPTSKAKVREALTAKR